MANFVAIRQILCEQELSSTLLFLYTTILTSPNIYLNSTILMPYTSYSVKTVQLKNQQHFHCQCLKTLPHSVVENLPEFIKKQKILTFINSPLTILNCHLFLNTLCSFALGHSASLLFFLLFLSLLDCAAEVS